VDDLASKTRHKGKGTVLEHARRAKKVMIEKENTNDRSTGAGKKAAHRRAYLFRSKLDRRPTRTTIRRKLAGSALQSSRAGLLRLIRCLVGRPMSSRL